MNVKWLVDMIAYGSQGMRQIAKHLTCDKYGEARKSKNGVALEKFQVQLCVFLLAMSLHLQTSFLKVSCLFTCGQVNDKFGGVDVLLF